MTLRCVALHYTHIGVALKLGYGSAHGDPGVWISLDHLRFGMDRGVWIGGMDRPVHGVNRVVRYLLETQGG